MRKAQNYQWKEMSLGTCYYPEHWDKKTVEGRSGQDAGKWHSHHPHRGVCLE